MRMLLSQGTGMRTLRPKCNAGMSPALMRSRTVRSEIRRIFAVSSMVRTAWSARPNWSSQLSVDGCSLVCKANAAPVARDRARGGSRCDRLRSRTVTPTAGLLASRRRRALTDVQRPVTATRSMVRIVLGWCCVGADQSGHRTRRDVAPDRTCGRACTARAGESGEERTVASSGEASGGEGKAAVGEAGGAHERSSGGWSAVPTVKTGCCWTRDRRCDCLLILRHSGQSRGQSRPRRL
jgi:hypothetical protein